MAERWCPSDRRARVIKRLKSILPGCCIILFPFAIIALAVLWRASWYYE